MQKYCIDMHIKKNVYRNVCRGIYATVHFPISINTNLRKCRKREYTMRLSNEQEQIQILRDALGECQHELEVCRQERDTFQELYHVYRELYEDRLEKAETPDM